MQAPSRAAADSHVMNEPGVSQKRRKVSMHSLQWFLVSSSEAGRTVERKAALISSMTAAFSIL